MKVSEDKYVSEDGKRVFERIPGTKYFTLNGLGKFIIPKGCTHLLVLPISKAPAQAKLTLAPQPMPSTFSSQVVFCAELHL